MHIASKIVHVGANSDPATGSISTPIYQNATFSHPALGQSTGFDYSRTKNPTRLAVEKAIADLEGGAAGFAFASGMAAITTLLMLYRSGDHVVVTEDCYGGTYRLLEKVFAKFGLETTFVDGSSIKAVAAAIRTNTRAIFIETPTNPLMKIADIRAIAALSTGREIHIVVDNTFLSPFFQRPLELGADIVIHSGSKYLSGHNDVICGLLTARDATVCEQIGFFQNAAGSILGPQDSWLLLRGIKTLALRMERHNTNASRLADWLNEHFLIKRVYYPGLPGHAGREIQESQATGYGGMLSFEVAEAHLVPQVLARVKMIRFAESLGGVESLITFPAVQTHADIPPDIRLKLGISDCLLRMSVGIENVEDLICDLSQALDLRY